MGCDSRTMIKNTATTENIERAISHGKSIRFLRGEIRDCRERGLEDLAEELEDDLFEKEYQLGETLRELGL